MEVVYTLIPSMIIVGLILVGFLVWAVKHGQYDDLEGDGQRILMDEDEDAGAEAATLKAKRERPDLNGPDAD